MAQLTVDEAAATYVAAMRDVLRPGAGVCAYCKTFIDEDYTLCGPCATSQRWLDVVVPITYSLHLGQMHTVLRRYKDGTPREQRFMRPRVAAILWRFLERHEVCVAAATGVDGFDLVTTVPSSTEQRDESSAFRTVVGWCGPVKERLERLLKPTGKIAAGRDFHPERYAAVRKLDGESVLLLDDTWASGGRAVGGARAQGAWRPPRRPRRDRPPPATRLGADTARRADHGELWGELPRAFDWDTCAEHV